jgi:hypothetical protein
MFGGGFDIGGHWEADIIDMYPDDPRRCNLVGHCGHRIGANVDIGFDLLDPGGERVGLGPSQLKTLTDIITGTTLAPLKERDHYHVTLL